MTAETSSEVAIMYNQTEITMIEPITMAMVKDKMYILHGKTGNNKLSVCKGVEISDKIKKIQKICNFLVKLETLL